MTRAQAIALHQWTTANRRAAADYYARPNRSCPRANCDQLADGRVCTFHARTNANDAARGRAKRRAAA